MRIEDATRTKDGTPVQIFKRLDDSSSFPYVGVFWFEEGQEWEPNRWNEEGKNECFFAGKDNLDLDLHDWCDEIPWECLRDEIQWVARMRKGPWIGFLRQPHVCENSVFEGWIGSIVCSLNGVKMPEGPTDWRQSLAQRPEDL